MASLSGSLRITRNDVIRAIGAVDDVTIAQIIATGTTVEELAEAGAEFAVEDSAADLEQEVGATTGPSHLLGFVHAAVDQEVGSAFGERGTDPQPGAMALGIVDQPSALAGQIAVDFAQRGPQSA